MSDNERNLDKNRKAAQRNSTQRESLSSRITLESFLPRGTARFALPVIFTLLTVGGTIWALSGERDISPKEANSIILKYIQTQGIKIDQKEIKLWQQESCLPPVMFLQPGESVTQAGLKRIDHTLRLMEESNVSEFKKAQALITKERGVRNEGRVRIDVVSGRNPRNPSQARLPYSIRPVAGQDRLEGVIEVAAASALMDPCISIALPLGHESKHLQNMFEFDKKLVGLTPDQRFQAEVSRSWDDTAFITEESSGYREEAMGYIHFRGLTGFPDNFKAFSFDQEALDRSNRLAAKAILYENNSQAWKALIAKEFAVLN